MGQIFIMDASGDVLYQQRSTLSPDNCSKRAYELDSNDAADDPGDFRRLAFKKSLDGFQANCSRAERGAMGPIRDKWVETKACRKFRT